MYIQRDEATTRLVLSILTIYRGLKYKAEPKTNTITDGFTGKTKVLPFFEINQALRDLGNVKRRWKINPNAHPLPSISAGPNGTVACLHMSDDAWAFKEY